MKRILTILLVVQFIFLLSGCCPCYLTDKPEKGDKAASTQEPQAEE